MKLDRVFPEPLLQFGGGGESPDIRHGIAEFGPVHLGTALHKTDVKIGLVGTAKTINSFAAWMTRCGEPVESDDPNNSNFSPVFPGLRLDKALGCEFTTSPTWTEQVSEEELKAVIAKPGAVIGLAEIFYDRIRTLFRLTSVKPDVVICLPPELVRKSVKPRLGDDFDPDIEDSEDEQSVDFHDYLKALCLQERAVFQLIWPRTYEEVDKSVQDEATRAWNLFTALFYKAGGVPWKLAKLPGTANTCYVGISFARRDDGGYMHSSLTQVFNDKGEGTILRGGLAKKSEEDWEVHLDAVAAKNLLSDAVENYRRANNQHLPQRVVIHKTSGFDAHELRGFNESAESFGVRYRDLLALNRSNLRFFRRGAYPPLRGTHVIFDERTSALYTRGSVPFYRKYPGAYVPTTLQIRCFQTDSTQSELAAEILALSKLNWNKTQFDSLFPITLEGSRRIGEIYRWCPNPPDEAVSYAFFM